ncbi:hypothetical protein [Janthinobacterium sp. SUN206]|uniref:hypothetical protein n=1 Tax=Janthinobacterium sp. SUN206 TaxID=3014787 RepID=UPI002713DFE3|nr:hypothetical protein [Janthinobacterium sp. SUN206]MDO8065449.1 hypothetical protein [Janthinobacterium sp. SUN206]
MTWLIRTGGLNLYPVNNAIGTMVHAAEHSNIDTVIIGGRGRKRGGVVLSVDQLWLHAAIDESCAHLFDAAGYPHHQHFQYAVKLLFIINYVIETC